MVNIRASRFAVESLQNTDASGGDMAGVRRDAAALPFHGASGSVAPGNHHPRKWHAPAI
jgi:hypothetical protein